MDKRRLEIKNLKVFYFFAKIYKVALVCPTRVVWWGYKNKLQGVSALEKRHGGLVIMERTIRVTGKGKVSVRPDVIRLLIKLADVRESYEDALKQSTLQVEMLKDLFEKFGFARSNLKTLSFNVEAEYESYQDKNKDWKKRFEGYGFVHRVKIEFDADNSHKDEKPEEMSSPSSLSFDMIRRIWVSTSKGPLLSSITCATS